MTLDFCKFKRTVRHPLEMFISYFSFWHYSTVKSKLPEDFSRVKKYILSLPENSHFYNSGIDFFIDGEFDKINFIGSFDQYENDVDLICKMFNIEKFYIESINLGKHFNPLYDTLKSNILADEQLVSRIENRLTRDYDKYYKLLSLRDSIITNIKQ